MALPPGERLGPYKIIAPLGKGGMGEVYRARDTRLDRDVAIKILPGAFASDADRIGRFEREARLLASLNQPNIATIYGIEHTGSVRAIALELVEGEDLSQRIRSGRGLPLPEVLAIARQIVDALDAAHERGIVHRDLKPGNIRLTPDGVVKVLDFGLAKASAEPEGVDLTHSPTTIGPTEDGVLLGTAPYMSPEQARGKLVDKRTDIWAFGCLVFEMLAGRRAYQGETTSDTIAAILEREPDWSSLPASTPIHIRHLLVRCLEKDQKQRLRDIADARPELHDRLAQPVGATRSTPPWVALAAVAVASIAGTAAIMSGWPNREAPDSGSDLARLTFDSGTTTGPSLTPDGTLLAYASTRSGRSDLDIWVQQMAGGPPLRITDDPAEDLTPDLSPDGSRVVFRSERANGGAYLAAALGGPARLIAPGARDPKFSPNGQSIAYWTGLFRGPLNATESSVFVLSLSGGTPIRLMPDFVIARNPVWSPDGLALLVVGTRSPATTISTDIDWWYVPIDGSTPTKTTILDRAGWRSFVQEERMTTGPWHASGFLISMDGTLWSVPLAPGTGRPAGEPRTLIFGAGNVARATASRDGVIVFGQSQGERAIEQLPLVSAQTSPPAFLIHSDGNPVPRRASATADGKTVLFERESVTSTEVWKKDLQTGELTLVLTVDSKTQINPSIAANGQQFVYTVEGTEPGKSRAYVVNIDGSLPRQICEDCSAWALFADGERALVVDARNTIISSLDLATNKSTALVTVPSGRLIRPSLSPDERWLAFRHGVGPVGKTYLLPATGGELGSATRIEEPTTTGRPCGWSTDSKVLMLLLDTDGSRCLWGQRVSSATGRPEGAPYVVRHLHHLGQAGASTSFGNAINARGFLYETLSRQSSLWRLTPKRNVAPE